MSTRGSLTSGILRSQEEHANFTKQCNNTSCLCWFWEDHYKFSGSLLTNGLPNGDELNGGQNVINYVDVDPSFKGHCCISLL
ncbi:uncharacterized protein ANIA_11658 [Aspergillus nidulans FGSC A4]|uniref:Uncharacterized protein n=1 Tax=Emericella nidulans (strain FGSC A4 / ATCC 38163 / CBS 112.46 / NRRL 194 / M139) TaxID=227321 RepID=C8VR53_EMENI|nr:hypothetical protein [Aspergillus nidulans FGSC A4]CBF87452.1 TPA: hypothetical protein ANIA_11658 [Aspergillus nidulans FGSC A4]